MRIAAVIFALLTATFATQAQARHHRHHHIAAQQNSIHCDRFGCRGMVKAIMVITPRRHYDANGNDPRPRAWCGWFLRHELGVADRAYNLARNWARYGSRAAGPAVGVVVVWPHHVGIITGHTETGWILKSGNDGHAVRERERSLRGAIAFRWPSRMGGL